MTQTNLAQVSGDDLVALFDLKYRQEPTLGSDPARRLRYRYFNPDDRYEALVRRLVTGDTRWLDVGCGRDLFPSNRPLAAELAARCALLVGVDPDDTVQENPFVHEKVQGLVDDLDSGLRFDLVTMRMVAEHVADPPALIRTLARFTVPGACVVVYTVNRFSPVPLITAVTPFSLHNPIKRILWRTEAKDTFPTTFRMNTRAVLARLFDAGGFDEAGFAYLDDCRTLQRFRPLNVLELELQRALRTAGLRYPENCLLGVYRRRGLKEGAEVATKHSMAPGDSGPKSR